MSLFASFSDISPKSTCSWGLATKYVTAKEFVHCGQKGSVDANIRTFCAKKTENISKIMMCRLRQFILKWLLFIYLNLHQPWLQLLLQKIGCVCLQCIAIIITTVSSLGNASSILR